MLFRISFILVLVIVSLKFTIAQDLEVIRNEINTSSVPEESELTLTLVARIQHYNAKVNHQDDHYDQTIQSPKSANILSEKEKLYIQSLEGFSTSVYDLTTLKRIKVIKHRFKQENLSLFRDTSVFDYKFRNRKSQFNIFKGKPVESCFSHNGKYLWVTYYRRDFDYNAQSPSAVAIIDTDKDSIVRVMPTGPLPKMIATSPDNKFIAVTHWGDNTVGLINIDSDNIWDFKYVKHLIVDKKIELNYDDNDKADRDHGCGLCLRGTVFTKDGNHLLVGRMGGGGIAIFDMKDLKYLGSIFGMQPNIRHLLINGEDLIISTNVSGYVQKTNLNSFLNFRLTSKDRYPKFSHWENNYVGKGARTITTTSDGNYIFAAVNNLSKIVAIRASDMKTVATISADSFPVGMAISDDNKKLVVTSQGRNGKGGNSVMIFNIQYN